MLLTGEEDYNLLMLEEYRSLTSPLSYDFIDSSRPLAEAILADATDDLAIFRSQYIVAGKFKRVSRERLSVKN